MCYEARSIVHRRSPKLCNMLENGTVLSKMKKNKEVDPIPEHFASIEEAVEFWDTHDTGDYEPYLKEVQVVNLNLKTITREVRFEPEVALKVAKLAEAKGLSFSDLINFWVKEKLNSQTESKD